MAPQYGNWEGLPQIGVVQTQEKSVSVRPSRVHSGAPKTRSAVTSKRRFYTAPSRITLKEQRVPHEASRPQWNASAQDRERERETASSGYNAEERQ